MYLRVDRGRVAPGKLDAFTAFIARDVSPKLRRIAGYRSTSIAADRKSGAVAVAIAWETPQARDQSDRVLADVLRNADRFELQPIQIDLLEDVWTDANVEKK